MAISRIFFFLNHSLFYIFVILSECEQTAHKHACVHARCAASSSAWGHRTEKRAVSPVTYGRWPRPVTDSWGISLNVCLTFTIHRVQRRGIKLFPFAGFIISVLETDTSLFLIVVLQFLFICCNTVWGAACTTCNIIPS